MAVSAMGIAPIIPPMPDTDTPTPAPRGPQPEGHPGSMSKVFASHARRWQDFHYVYPVISRRSKGLSIGINLNIDKACNFDCIYCCVDRAVSPVRKDVDLEQVRSELQRMLDLAVTGKIWDEAPFSQVETRFRRINDIAFSGDGEPTTYPRFDEACQMVADLKNTYQLSDVKIVMITNATMFDKPTVQRAMGCLDINQGEIWAKLDAGTADYYRLVDSTKFPFDKLLRNILACGLQRPIVLQSLFMQIHGKPVSDVEFEAYLQRIRDLIGGGCQIKLVQLYTTARWTAQPYVSPLSDQYLDKLAVDFKQAIPAVPVEVYYGVA